MDGIDEIDGQSVEGSAEARQQAVGSRVARARQQRNWELTMLSRLGHGFTATLDLQQVTDQLLPATTEIIGAEGASVWLWDDAAEGWLICRTAYHHGQKTLPIRLALGPGQGVAGWVAQSGQSAIVLDVQSDPRFFSGIDQRTGFETRSLLAVPLWTGDRVIGVLEVVNKCQGAFDADDRVLAETLASSAAIAIDNARMVETLRQRTLDLQACQGKLDHLTHTLANDLRGRLGFIISSAQVLDEGCETLPVWEMRHYLHAIARKGNEMVGFIDDLLLARIEPPKEVEEEIESLDMAKIVSTVLERLSYMVDRYRAEVILPEDWPVALGYAPWVEEVWTQYISNAIRYGGRPPRVEIGFGATIVGPVIFPSAVEALGALEHSTETTEQAHETVRFWVRDNGPGLAPQEQVRLFASTARADQGRESAYGVELSLVRRIVERLDGQVGVESKVGQGSLFYFTLPVAGK